MALFRWMMRHWAAFATNGRLGVARQRRWPRLTAATHRTLVLCPSGNTLSNGVGAEHHCAFWSSIA
jgi:carboxylesterase type B